MTNFDIKINIRDIMHYSESLGLKLEKKTLLLLIESFSDHILLLYEDLIIDSINSRRYGGEWEPVNEEGYIEYLGVTPKENIISVIEDALEVVKIGYNFVIRIDPHCKYPGTRLPLLKVLRAIEYGTSKFNSRPIFAKIVRRISRDIPDYWREYLAMKGVI